MYNSAWRSHLSRRLRPILSHLIPTARRRHAGVLGPVVSPGGAASSNRATSRAYYTDTGDQELNDDDATVPPAALASDASGKKKQPTFHHSGCECCGHPHRLTPPPRPHLYVAVDDWSEGFSVHKIDLDDDHHHADQHQRRLPSPAAFRMEFSNVCAGAQFAAVGRSIVSCTQGTDGLTVVHDTGTAAHAIVRPSPYPLLFEKWHAAVAAAGGDRLYAFVPGTTDLLGKSESDDYVSGGMYIMEQHIERPVFPFCNNDQDNFYHDRERWSWSRDPSPLPFHLDRSSRIVSYAVHPEGKEIFVSVKIMMGKKDKAGTYSYDTESGVWTYHGGWMLPFTGEAVYDAELDAWVGHYQITKQSPGSLVCCDIPSQAAAGAPAKQPNLKDCEAISSAASAAASALPNNMDAVLVSMGSGRLCLVESVARDGLTHSWGSGDRFELRSRYGKNGELLSTDRQLARSYVHSRYAGYDFNVHAFWMWPVLPTHSVFRS